AWVAGAASSRCRSYSAGSRVKHLSGDRNSVDEGAGDPPSSRHALDCQAVVMLIAWFLTTGANGARPRFNPRAHSGETGWYHKGDRWSDVSAQTNSETWRPGSGRWCNHFSV